MADIAAELAQRREEGLLRQRRVVQSAPGVEIVVAGKPLLSFCSNDYLGLAGHPAVTDALKTAADRFGVGSGAAHLVCGHHESHHELEEALAAHTGREAALLFSTGYMANLGVISALAARGERVYQDRLNHASLLDGARLSGARLIRYQHGDAQALEERLLNRASDGLVVTDGVFSMDGDLAPLPDLAAVCHRHGLPLMVDDAHGIGVLGATGGGVVEYFGLSQAEVPVLMGTLGKGLGTAGAFVAGSRDLIDYLIQKARTYIYTTAMPPALAAATLCSLRISREETWRRDRLQDLVHRFRAGAEALGYRLMPSDSPIQPIEVGSARDALQLSGALEQKGILVTAIRPPTVPVGRARLRVTLSAAHTDEHLAQLLKALAEVRHEVGVP